MAKASKPAVVVPVVVLMADAVLGAAWVDAVCRAVWPGRRAWMTHAAEIRKGGRGAAALWSSVLEYCEARGKDRALWHALESLAGCQWAAMLAGLPAGGRQVRSAEVLIALAGGAPCFLVVGGLVLEALVTEARTVKRKPGIALEIRLETIAAPQ